MKLHELRAVPGSTRDRKRRGRGTATGQGKTSGRGMNGQNSRSGGGTRPGFEGGQMPLYRRLPKRGFTNIWRVEPAIINIGDLNEFENGTEITAEVLIEKGLIKKADAANGLKVLGSGILEKSLTVKANKFSKSAAEAIEKAGGKVEVL